MELGHDRRRVVLTDVVLLFWFLVSGLDTPLCLIQVAVLIVFFVIFVTMFGTSSRYFASWSTLIDLGFSRFVFGCVFSTG